MVMKLRDMVIASVSNAESKGKDVSALPEFTKLYAEPAGKRGGLCKFVYNINI